MNALGHFLNNPMVAVAWLGLMFAIISGQWVGSGGDFWAFTFLAATFSAAGYWVGMTRTFQRDTIVINQIIDANHGLAKALAEATGQPLLEEEEDV